MLFVMSSGKAMKTFQAVTYMAVPGFGEDACPPLTHSFTQHEKLMRLGFDEAPKMRRPFADQAGILPKSYYDKQYRFVSSFRSRRLGVG